MPTEKSFHLPCDPDTDSGNLEEAIHRAVAGYAEDHGCHRMRRVDYIDDLTKGE